MDFYPLSILSTDNYNLFELTIRGKQLKRFTSVSYFRNSMCPQINLPIIYPLFLKASAMLTVPTL
jgi:hypothetical protein